MDTEVWCSAFHAAAAEAVAAAVGGAPAMEWLCGAAGDALCAPVSVAAAEALGVAPGVVPVAVAVAVGAAATPGAAIGAVATVRWIGVAATVGRISVAAALGRIGDAAAGAGAHSRRRRGHRGAAGLCRMCRRQGARLRSGR